MSVTDTTVERKPKTSEHSLQVMVLDYLSIAALPGVFAFAIPNAARRSYAVARKMRHEGMMAGVADLCVMLPAGRVGWLEMKTQQGRQSIGQKGFAARCLRLNHPYAVARSFDEAVKILRLWGALK